MRPRRAVTRIYGRFRTSPFPNVPNQINHAPLVLPGRTRTDRRGRRILDHRGLVLPLRTPRIQVALFTVARRILPFFFRRQTISHAVALGTPRRKRKRVVKRNVHDRPQLLSERWLVSDPMTRSRVV